MSKRALITGISGQDGSYLAELLIQKGYEVHGLLRNHHLERGSGKSTSLSHLHPEVRLHFGELENPLFMLKLFQKVLPDECYHLAAPSFVSYSLEDELANFNSGFTSTHCLVSALKEIVPKCRLYFAGSSEIFGDVQTAPQNEQTPMRPRSLYGISKMAAYHLLRNFRDKNDLFVSCGFLYNHESPRRAPHFVTRKISMGVARIKLGLQDKLTLGNLDVSRDWGYAPEYAAAMWQMLQHSSADDFVVATGKLRTLKDFIDMAFRHVDLDWQDYVVTDPAFFRPAEKVPLVGDASKAEKILGWKARHPFSDLVREMVDADLSLLK